MMNDTCNDNSSTQEFYKNKYAIVNDLRTVDDETIVGSGRRLVGTQSGVLLEVEKLETSFDLMCHVFVSYKKLNTKNNKHEHPISYDHRRDDKLWQNILPLKNVRRRI